MNFWALMGKNHCQISFLVMRLTVTRPLWIRVDQHTQSNSLPAPESLFEMASFCIKHDWQAIIFLKAEFHFFLCCPKEPFLFHNLKVSSLNKVSSDSLLHKASGITCTQEWDFKKNHYDGESRPQSDSYLRGNWGNAVHTHISHSNCRPFIYRMWLPERMMGLFCPSASPDTTGELRQELGKTYSPGK